MCDSSGPKILERNLESYTKWKLLTCKLNTLLTELKIAVFYSAMFCPEMEAECSSETLVTNYQTALRRIGRDLT